MQDKTHEPMSEHQYALAKKLDATGWGLFFIWVGIGLLANISWGATLLGLGVIVLGIQAARIAFGLSVEGFWLVAGIVFAVGGGWEMLEARLGRAPLPSGLLPVLSIVVGIGLIITAFLHRRD